MLHLDVFSKTLIELEHYLPKDLYSFLDARRKFASQMDKEMKESELVNQCTNITMEEIDRLILQENTELTTLWWEGWRKLKKKPLRYGRNFSLRTGYK